MMLASPRFRELFLVAVILALLVGKWIKVGFADCCRVHLTCNKRRTRSEDFCFVERLETNVFFLYFRYEAIALLLIRCTSLVCAYCHVHAIRFSP